MKPHFILLSCVYECDSIPGLNSGLFSTDQNSKRNQINKLICISNNIHNMNNAYSELTTYTLITISSVKKKYHIHNQNYMDEKELLIPYLFMFSDYLELPFPLLLLDQGHVLSYHFQIYLSRS